jgi:hypothetical protein
VNVKERNAMKTLESPHDPALLEVAEPLAPSFDKETRPLVMGSGRMGVDRVQSENRDAK